VRYGESAANDLEGMEGKAFMSHKNARSTHNLSTETLRTAVHGLSLARLAGILLQILNEALQTKEFIQVFFTTGEPFFDFRL
jgi:hypothetical protein